MHVTTSSDISAALDRYAAFPGFCAREKVWFMYELAKTINPELVVEAGVYGGRTLFPMALGAPSAQVIGIDSWRADECIQGEPDQYHDTWKTHDFESKYRFVVDEIRSSGIPIQIIRANHLEAASNFPNLSIDLFHEDANHSPSIIRRSMNTWIPKLKIGGILVWDDPGWGDGQDVVEYVRSKCGLELIESRAGYDVLRKVSRAF